MYACMYVYMRACVCMYVCMYVCMHVCVCMHTYPSGIFHYPRREGQVHVNSHYDHIGVL